MVDERKKSNSAPLNGKFINESEWLENRGDIVLDFGELRRWREAFHNIAVSINEKFGEIPFNRTASEKS